MWNDLKRYNNVLFSRFDKITWSIYLLELIGHMITFKTLTWYSANSVGLHLIVLYDRQVLKFYFIFLTGKLHPLKDVYWSTAKLVLIHMAWTELTTTRNLRTFLFERFHMLSLELWNHCTPDCKFQRCIKDTDKSALRFLLSLLYLDHLYLMCNIFNACHERCDFKTVCLGKSSEPHWAKDNAAL